MRKSILLLTGIFFLISQLAQAQASKKANEIDTVISRLASKYQFSGTVLVADKGKIILHKGYSLSIVDKNDTCKQKTYYQIGSITKTFTATTILLLQEDSLLHVSDKLSKYYPDYPKGDSITIENLLMHTSGIFNYTEDADFMLYKAMEHIDEKEMVALFKDKPLAFTPGSQYSYSNSNYMLLGYIIEKVTGKTYFEVVREKIFAPLKMTNSGFSYNTFPSWDKAQGYFVMRPGRVTPSPTVDSSVSYAAGTMFTTTGDMYKWAQAVISKKLLSKNTWAKAHTPNENGYAYGWIVKDSASSKIGKKYIGHNGAIHGFKAEFYMVPEDKSVVIILGNDMNDNVGELAKTIGAILYDKPYDKREPKKEIKLSEEVMAEYEGRYALAENLDILIYTQTGSVWAQPTKQLPFRILNYKKDHFFVEEAEVEISFVRDDKGKISHMILKQNGQEVKGRKWQ